MNASQQNIDTFQLSRESKLRSTALAESIKFVGRGDNRRALVIAGDTGNWEAKRIIELFHTVSSGNYRMSEIDELNLLVADWQASHA
jgi:hypothetical protein